MVTARPPPRHLFPGCEIQDDLSDISLTTTVVNSCSTPSMRMLSDGRSGNRRQQGDGELPGAESAPAVRSRTGDPVVGEDVLEGRVGADEISMVFLLPFGVRHMTSVGHSGARPQLMKLGGAPSRLVGGRWGRRPHSWVTESEYSTISCSVSGTSICARSGSWWIKDALPLPTLAASSGSDARPPSPGNLERHRVQGSARRRCRTATQ